MLLSSGYFHYLIILNKHLFLYLGSCLGDPWPLGLEIPTEVSKRVCFLGNGLIFVSYLLVFFSQSTSDFCWEGNLGFSPLNQFALIGT